MLKLANKPTQFALKY